MRVLPYGEHCLLIEVTDYVEALALYEDIARQPPAGLVDLVPGAASVLVVFGSGKHASMARTPLGERTVAAMVPTVGKLVEVPAVYDGEDLHEVANSLGMSTEELIARHESVEYVVAFIGFAPGFAYLAGLDPALRVPRHGTPRTRVPAGSIAVAGEFTAVYPNESPGGWQLLGHTTLKLWDLDHTPPALLQPGGRVRFRRVAP